MKDDGRILYDARSGRVSGPDNGLSGPEAAGDQTLWAVVHDSRGGVNWLSVPIHGR